MKTVQHAFAFSDKSEWAWPDDDRWLFAVIDDVLGIDKIMQYVNDRTNPSHGGKIWKARTVVQAGGACGIWPYRLSQLFDTVITVEPLDNNYQALIENVQGLDNVFAFHGCLGSGDEPFGQVGMKRPRRDRNNAGSQQVELGVFDILNDDDEVIRTYDVHTIDRIARDHIVDAIILDIEGYEIPALMGAVEIIQRCHPVICVEDKGLSRKFGYTKGMVARWLRPYGYRVAERMQRDIILVAS